MFINGEGDAWFSRNLENSNTQLVPVDIDFIFSTLGTRKNEIANILEIGCSSGVKVKTLSEKFDAYGYGIDPSQVAIESARKYEETSDGKLQFLTGIATDLPYEDSKFDLVFFGFCLYLVPPNEIYKAISEADRVLKNGGFLAILDFDYGQLKVNPYKHADGIYSYKNNYSALLTSSGYFHQVSKWSFSQNGISFIDDRNERLSIEVLHKELNEAFN
jgi:ubiquinone/menaquinone biosynthesis C-methylase UbiE